jgi:hypothetical protein
VIDKFYLFGSIMKALDWVPNMEGEIDGARREEGMNNF